MSNRKEQPGADRCVEDLQAYCEGMEINAEMLLGLV